MTFPVPAASSSESADVQRDERKRQASPPSSFIAQAAAILTAVRYVEPLHSGYPGSANKHKNRTRSALLVQLMAAFEFAMKDFIAQVLDATHIYDDEVKNWDWLKLDVATVLGTREGYGRLGAVLIHPLQGWQTPETMNGRFKNVFAREPIARTEVETLRKLWIVRHSIAHNGGVVTAPDARRLRAPGMTEKQLLIDLPFLETTSEFLKGIVLRLEAVVGPSVMERWFKEGSVGDWDADEEAYSRLKLLVTGVAGRRTELPDVDEAMYVADAATYMTP